jgi:hypothetical protein
MGAQANILVKDDATTPVEYMFIPVTDANGVPLWRTQIAGVPFEGQMQLWMSEETVKDGSFKRTIKVEIPVMETLGASGTSAGYVAPPKVAYKETHIHTTFSNRRSTQADRANSLKIALGILQGAYSTTGGGILANTAAGDAFKTSTRPAPDFMINGVTPN